MIDVTDLFQRYRECSRHVWNSAFLDLPEGWHEFINVDAALFSALVLVQTDESHEWRAERSEQGCYPSLRVSPRLGPRGFRIMWAIERPANEWHWEERQLTSATLKLAYIGFFDFVDGQDAVDLQYVRARMLSCEEFPDLVGADILLEAHSVAMHFSPG
ncbi:MAG: hypothetical protein WCJ30_19305 [Deltaproteobacteria bacterium]